MFTRAGLRIGRILGIPIYLDASWVFIFAVMTYSLVMRFTAEHPHWTVTQQWTSGISTSILFFASVLFHELSHSVVAQQYKIRVISITLFIFGGVARIGREPSKAIQEFNIAIAGPLASYFLAASFFAFALVFSFSETLAAVCQWLFQINFMLATFNLLPGFPLDGGRIFRAIVWGVTKDFPRATRVAGASGKLVAYGIIVWGASYFFKGQWGSGAWLAFIGWYLLSAARDSVAQLAMRETLDGLRATDVMNTEVPTINRNTSLEEYGAEVLRTGRRCHLVVTDDRLVGMMNVPALNSIPRSEWAENSVQAVMIPRERILWAAPEESLLRLLERLLAADINQMPVVSTTENDGAHIIGMITRNSILRVMQTRSEIGPAS
ncbi:MAG TPA: site-2 protease family protein [Candidatus Dormibacteraeota bacterium]|nr:site-2 protease family protein [Candidatus Dormibacteraeota bacterium]